MTSSSTRLFTYVSLALFLLISCCRPESDDGSSSAEKCNPEDKKVLLSIKKSLHDPYILTSWNPSLDCCHDWNNVVCHPTTGRITTLSLAATAQVSGQIPPAVGDLPFLETLTFHHLSNVTGGIPPTIAKLKHLKYLTLSYLNLTGTAPEFLSTLSNLTILDLSFNSLTGPVPASYYKLKKLTTLHLDRNELTGTIPNSYGLFSKDDPPYVYLSHNRLTGTIPSSLGNVNWQVIDLSRNKLEGDASMMFNSNKSFYRLDISRNMLEFDLGKVEIPSGLADLDMNHNRIFGNIPTSMASLGLLQHLNMSYNRLCGEIPVGGKMQDFDDSVYFHNRCLCGSPLPECK